MTVKILIILGLMQNTKTESEKNNTIKLNIIKIIEETYKNKNG